MAVIAGEVEVMKRCQVIFKKLMVNFSFKPGARSGAREQCLYRLSNRRRCCPMWAALLCSCLAAFPSLA